MGKLHFVGRWDQCVDTEVKYWYNDTDIEGEERQFTGRYCRLDLNINLTELVWHYWGFKIGIWGW